VSWVYPGSRLCVCVPFLVHEGRCVPAIAGLSPSVFFWVEGHCVRWCVLAIARLPRLYCFISFGFRGHCVRWCVLAIAGLPRSYLYLLGSGGHCVRWCVLAIAGLPRSYLYLFGFRGHCVHYRHSRSKLTLQGLVRGAPSRHHYRLCQHRQHRRHRNVKPTRTLPRLTAFYSPLRSRLSHCHDQSARLGRRLVFPGCANSVSRFTFAYYFD